ncbi:MAG TPA: helix-turn-helix domain-containing protein [Blastocatellia bacterium]|nr:helix-turn-helix domain-containing protein [Blastocatellia bacterium]
MKNAGVERMARIKSDKPKGVLKPPPGGEGSHYARYHPSPDLEFFVEHYWIVQWNLTGQEPRLQETLPHPSIHLVFQRHSSRVVGVVTGRFSILLSGRDGVFGIKFLPGAFYPFLKSPVSRITNKVLCLTDVFDVDVHTLEDAIMSQTCDYKMIELAEAFLRERLPDRDEKVPEVRRIVERILTDREITSVDDVVDRTGMNKRALQRLFSRYVGASPKWVIKRYRLLEAAEQLASNQPADLSRLAVDLGYFDQAHFIKDFKSIVGKSPAEFAKSTALEP